MWCWVVKGWMVGWMVACGGGAPADPAPETDSEPEEAVEALVGPVDPLGLMLSWQRDPTTTMTVDWHVSEEEPFSPRMAFRPADGEVWTVVEGTTLDFPHTDRKIHRVELTDLSPDTSYAIRLADDGEPWTFRTLPATLSRPVRFAAGGDTRHLKFWMEQTNRAAMAHDPDFVMWGGDLAYADGRADRAPLWIEWFDAVKQTLIDEDRRVVPVVVGIGNHEVIGGYHTSHFDYEPVDAIRERMAPFFYSLFAFPGHPGYAALDVGDYLSLIVLDTDHSNPIDGPQKGWLAQALESRAGVPHVFPMYHVPGWPSHRDPEGGVSTRVREHWVPLFEEHGVRLAFENHDHTYKRTHPLRGGEVREGGVVYMGDGAWGVNTRDGNHFDQWYIAQAQSVRHALLVTLETGRRHVRVVDVEGNTLDQLEQALE